MISKENVPAFQSLMNTLQSLLSRDYQARQWVAREGSGISSCFYNDTLYFLEDSDALIEAYEAGRVEMTDKQYQMLKKLYEMVDEYDDLMDRPRTDEGIVNDPRWGKVREYAKVVYEELKKH